MGLRLSTAMTLVLSLGLVTACGDDEAEVAEVEAVDEEVVVVEEPVEEELTDDAVSTDEAVVEDEAEVVVVEEEPVEEEADANVIAEAGGDDPIELETDVESDGEPITATAGEEEATLADPAEEVADATGEADATADDSAEVVVVDPEADAETDLAAADVEAPADEDDGMATLETNVTVVEDGVDAEARVDPAASEDAQVEETNDVATDGVDSASEAEMLDLDNLVLDEEGVQRLTEYVEASDIEATQKVTIVNGIDAARDNPERLEEILEQVRELSAQ